MAGTGAAFAPRTSFESYRHPKIMNQSSSLLTRRNAAMPVAEPAVLEVAAAPPSASERLVDQLASRTGGLGVELADVPGNLQEVSAPVPSTSPRVADHPTPRRPLGVHTPRPT